MSKILPVILFGSDNFSIHFLKEFLKKYKPLLVLTLGPKPQGRGLKMVSNPVFLFCIREKINVIELKNWQDFKKKISLLKPQAGIIASFGKIIPQEIINLFPKGIINVHPSLLPKYRGPNPIRETILNNENETGTTIFIIDDKVDHGPIICKEKINLSGKETYLELEEKLAKLGGQLINSIIEKFLKNQLDLETQNDLLATYTKKVSKQDGKLNLDDDYLTWDKKIRALNPWPGTYIYICSKKTSPDNPNHQSNYKMLKIFKVEKIKQGDLPKEILKTDIGEFFEFKNELGLRLKDSFVFLKEVQLEGKKKMSGKEFLNGFRKLIFKR